MQKQCAEEQCKHPKSHDRLHQHIVRLCPSTKGRVLSRHLCTFNVQQRLPQSCRRVANSTIPYKHSNICTISP